MTETGRSTTTYEWGEGATTGTFSRVFAGTPEQLLRAHTDPALYAQWIGPRKYTTVVELFEPRHGGAWAFTQTGPDGDMHSFRGVFHGDLSVEHGILQTFEYLGAPGHVNLDRITFEDLGGGRTRLVGLTAWQSAADLAAMKDQGMQAGMDEGYDRLDELLATL
jgi:uncharacterized protein YndB with AHSA1/START domain